MTFVLIKLIQKQQVFQHCCSSWFAFGLFNKEYSLKNKFYKHFCTLIFSLGSTDVNIWLYFQRYIQFLHQQRILNLYINGGHMVPGKDFTMTVCCSQVSVWVASRFPGSTISTAHHCFYYSFSLINHKPLSSIGMAIKQCPTWDCGCSQKPALFSPCNGRAITRLFETHYIYDSRKQIKFVGCTG